VIVIIMGTTGAGKTTIGTMLATQINWQFADADTFHPPANIEKCPKVSRSTTPTALLGSQPCESHPRMDRCRKNLVLACSALKRAYREELRASPEVKIVYLKGSYALFAERIRRRHGHFAGERILAGQFADLEEPADAITIDAAQSPEQIVAEIRKQLGLS